MVKGTMTWASALAALALVACSSSGSDGSDGSLPSFSDAGGDAASGSTPEAGGASTLGSDAGAVSDAGASGEAGGDAGDATGGGDAGDSQTVTLAMTPYTVAPGDEVYRCQRVGNPFGQDVDIVSVDGTSDPTAVKFFLFDITPDSAGAVAAPVTACPGAGLEFHGFAFLSQQPHFVQTFPDGAGYPVNADHGLMLNVHLRNPGSQPVTVSPSVTVKVLRRALVQTHVGSLYLPNATFEVPVTPRAAPVSVTTSVTPLDHDFQLLTSWSQQDSRSLGITASLGGKPIYQEANWHAPQPFQHQPYVQGKAGDAFSWTCSKYNDSARTLTFGDSAVNNAECTYYGFYTPADPAHPGIVDITIPR